MYAEVEAAKAPIFVPVAIVVQMIPASTIATPGITPPNGEDLSHLMILLAWIQNRLMA